MDLFGWDTVSYLDMKTVNYVLSRSSSQFPTDFVLTGTDFFHYDVNGKYGEWQIVAGGSAQIVRTSVAFASGTCTFGTGTSEQSVDLSDVAVLLDISLALVPDGISTALCFDFSAVAAKGVKSAPGFVTPIGVVDPLVKLPPVIADALPSLIASDLVAHAAEVQHAFATINPSGTGSFDWITPVATGYCFQTDASGKQVLALLSVVNARDTSSLPLAIDPALLAVSAAIVFAISPGMFLQHLIQPTLPSAFGNGATTASFLFDRGQPAINNAVVLATSGVTKGAITYQPLIDTLTIAVIGANLLFESSGSCDLKMNMAMTFEISAICPCTWNTSMATLVVNADPSPSQQHTSHIPWYDYLLGPIPSLIMALVVPSIAGGIADSLSSEFSAAWTMTSSSPVIDWTGVGSLQVLQGGLDTSFYIAGNAVALI